MKNFRLILLATIVALTSFAFAKPATEAKAFANLHWFDPSGAYIGSRTIDQQESLCPGNNSECAKGYNGVTGSPEQPVGAVQYTARKNP